MPTETFWAFAGYGILALGVGCGLALWTWSMSKL